MSTIVVKAFKNQPFGRENKKLTENKNGTTDTNILSVLVGISSGLFCRMVFHHVFFLEMVFHHCVAHVRGNSNIQCDAKSDIFKQKLSEKN
jgi:hypothetical protein